MKRRNCFALLTTWIILSLIHVFQWPDRYKTAKTDIYVNTNDKDDVHDLIMFSSYWPLPGQYNAKTSLRKFNKRIFENCRYILNSEELINTHLKWKYVWIGDIDYLLNQNDIFSNCMNHPNVLTIKVSFNELPYKNESNAVDSKCGSKFGSFLDDNLLKWYNRIWLSKRSMIFKLIQQNSGKLISFIDPTKTLLCVVDIGLPAAKSFFLWDIIGKIDTFDYKSVYQMKYDNEMFTNKLSWFRSKHCTKNPRWKAGIFYFNYLTGMQFENEFNLQLHKTINDIMNNNIKCKCFDEELIQTHMGIINISTKPLHATTRQSTLTTAAFNTISKWNNSKIIANMSHDQYCQFMHSCLLYIENCSWSTKKSKMPLYDLLITSTPRSGTTFMAKLLNEIGIRVVHEGKPNPSKHVGLVSWMHAFWIPNETYPMQRMGASIGDSRFKHVFHQIREPLQSMSSLCTEPVLWSKHWYHLNKNVNLSRIEDANSIEIVMQYYYEWHTKLNNFGFPIFHIENIIGEHANNASTLDTLNLIINESDLQHHVTDKVLLSGKMSDHLYQLLHVEQPENNARKHRKVLTWDELFLLNKNYAFKIWNLANEYGYKYDWDYSLFNKTTRFIHPFRHNPRKYIQCGEYEKKKNSHPAKWGKVDDVYSNISKVHFKQCDNLRIRLSC